MENIGKIVIGSLMITQGYIVLTQKCTALTAIGVKDG